MSAEGDMDVDSVSRKSLPSGSPPSGKSEGPKTDGALMERVNHSSAVNMTPGKIAGKRRNEYSPGAMRDEIKKEEMEEKEKATVQEYVESMKTLFAMVQKMKKSLTAEEMKNSVDIANNMVVKIGTLGEHIVVLGKTEADKSVNCRKCNQPAKRDILKDIDQCSVKIGQGKIKSDEELVSLLDEKWLEQHYQRTKIVEGNPVKEKEGNFLLVKGDQAEKTALTGIFKSRYPDIEEVIEEGLVPGEVQYVLSQSSTSRGGNKSHKVYIVNAIESQVLAYSNVCKEIKREFEDDSILNVAATKAYDWSKTRKYLELAFRGTKININLFVPKKNEVSREISTINKEKPDIITVKSIGGMAYADMVKNIRNTINPSGLGVPVKSITKSKNEEMVIVTAAGKGDILKSEIASKIGDTEVTIRGSKSSKILLQVTNIEETLTKSQIVDEIKKNIGLESFSEENMITLFNNNRGSQSCLVSLGSELASDILKQGTINIGWIKCAVSVRVTAIRCFNCLKIGHKAAKCTNEKVLEPQCFKCTEKGHTSKDCDRNSYCNECKKPGHTNGSNACPAFREYLKKKRGENERRKSQWKRR